MLNFAIKLKLVLWKNFLTWKRHYMLSIFEILLPLIMCSMLNFVYIVSPKFNKVFISETKYHKPWSPGKLKYPLFYTPNDSNVTSIIQRMGVNAEGFANEIDMVKRIDSYVKKKEPIPVGVVIELFEDTYLNILKYQIRTDSRTHVESLFDYDSLPFQSNDKENYLDKFIPTQFAIDSAYIDRSLKKKRYVTGESVERNTYNTMLQEIPYPPHTDLGQLSKYIFLLPLCTILAFVFMFPSLLKRIIEEKSTGIKEFMKIDAWILWLGWFIHSMAINIIVITIVALILTVNMSVDTPSIFGNSDPTTLGMCMGILVWVTPYFCFSYLIMKKGPYMPYQYFVMFWPNNCLVYGYKALCDFEFEDNGLTWSNFMKVSGEYTPHPSMGFVCFMLLIDCTIFLTLTWFIENVFLGKYSIARPWNYLFTKFHWCTKKFRTIRGHLAHIEGRHREGFETVSADTSAAIQIHNMSKLFRKKPAVDNLSIDIYENEITVLLGPNGAGKTVTINIITGMISPNSGTVVVNGFNIQSNITKVRESMGFCPQHNLQISDLTVLEHLMFFAMLKGLSNTAAKLESKQFLSRFNMSSKANNMASSLSGGMRRKLSLGMALVGHTRVLILDEPTSGLDPEARRQIWDLLLSMRGERTILITTHYMLEADILGDRIAIMHHGKLMCYGTSLFLKNHYGTGSTLSLLVTKSWKISTITEAIHNKIPSATVKSISADFVTFALPTTDAKALSALFSSLEMNKSQLSISSVCVSLTTMEEVFLRVSEIAEEIDNLLTKECTCEPNSKQNVKPFKDLLTGRSLLRHQFLGLLFKRYQYARHRWIMFLLQVLIPLALIAIIMIISENATKPVDRRDMVSYEYTGSEPFCSDFTLITNGTKKHKSKFGDYTYIDLDYQQYDIDLDVLSDDIIQVGVYDLNRYHHTLIACVEKIYSATWTHSKLFWRMDHDNTVSLNAMYGNLALHGPSISLNEVSNFRLSDAVYFNSTSYITVENNPWPQFKPKPVIQLNMGVITTWIFLFPIVFTILVSFFLNFIHGERRIGFKHLQLMAGVPRVLYWAVIYLFDLIVYIAVGVIIIIIICWVDIGGPFGNWLSLGALSSLMLLYGFAILPFSYIFTYTSTVATSVLFFIWFHFFVSLATAAVFLLQYLGNPYKDIGKGLTYIFYIFPDFAFSNGIYKYMNHTKEIYEWEILSELQREIYHCKNMSKPCCNLTCAACKEFYSYYAGDDSITNNITSLGVDICLYFTILFLFDSGMPRKCYGKLRDFYYDKVCVNSALKQDVTEEQLRIQNQITALTKRRNDVLQVTNLRKIFGKVQAVNRLNFNVMPRECIGLLGSNGAGKTTALKMLTGEIFRTSGTANLMGDQLHSKRSNDLKNIGYCPQFNALNLTLTCREMLQLFAYLRGIPSHLIHVHVNKWINKFSIKQYENICCGYLSGSNKRKLSIAVALIGSPPLVLLDVPTSGASSVARRNIWNILAELWKFEQSIILTSHSKVECETLCDRFAIMVDGEIKFIGYIQYLKRVYGQGFIVKIKLKSSAALTGVVTGSANEIKNIKRTFESKYSCTLIGAHTGMLLYHVTNRSSTLGEVFLFMEGLKSTVPILEWYSVCDTSLEQEFLSNSKDKINNEGKCKASASCKATTSYKATHMKCTSANVK